MKNVFLILALISFYNLQLQAQAGCTDPNAHNYDPNATTNDGSCETCFDGIQNGDETGVDCGGSNANCSDCILATQLEVDGDAKILGKVTLGGNASTETLLEYISPTDGFKMKYDGTYTAPTGDYLIFEKTDGHTNDPDGGIAFVNTGNDGIQETAMVIRGNGDVEMNEIHSLDGYIDIASDNWLTLDAINGSIDIAAAGSIIFRAGDSTIKMEIEPSGEVGIGTNSPSYKLEVNGPPAKPGGGSWSNSSDRRLKTNIRDFSKGLDIVNQVEPIAYHYNGKLNYSTEEEYVGVIAQELQKIAPFMVSDFEGEDGETYLAVDPSAFDFILINAVQELSIRLEKLENINQQLQEQNKQLSAQVKK